MSERIQVVMPMAGRATRFNQSHLEIAKPLIDVKGKKLFEWAFDSLNINENIADVVCIYTADLEGKFSISQEIARRFTSAFHVKLNSQTSGPVETVEHALKSLNDSDPIIVIDCDLHFKSRSFERFLTSPDPRVDASVLTFSSTLTAYSYVAANESDVSDIAEKKVIGPHAVCGCYYFKNLSILKQAAEEALKMYSGEVFMSDVIKVLLRRNFRVKHFPCDMHLSFGTPEELNYSKHVLDSF